MTVVTIFTITLLSNTMSHAATNRNTPDYFREFRTPLTIIANPMYERIQIVRMAEYVAYYSPFGIIPVDLFMIAKHESQMIEIADKLHYFDRY